MKMLSFWWQFREILVSRDYARNNTLKDNLGLIFRYVVFAFSW